MTETPLESFTLEEAADIIQFIEGELECCRYANRVNILAIEEMKAEIAKLRAALTRVRDCDWTVSLPTLRNIARDALS